MRNGVGHLAWHLIPILLVAATSCQMAPIGRLGSRIGATAAPTQLATNGPSTPTDMATQKVIIWARVFSCSCSDNPLGPVMSKLAEIKVDDGVRIVSVSDTSETFIVTFDSRQVATGQVVAAIQAGGGEILPDPSTPPTTRETPAG